MKEIAKTENELRDTKDVWPETVKELTEYIADLVDRQHDYGTCVYAMSLSAIAAFNFVAHKLGVSGFQASCADMDFIRRTRQLKCGFKILNYEDLLYPQYLNSEHFPTHIELLYENKEILSKLAQDRLASSPGAHPDVVARWQYIVNLGKKEIDKS